MLLGLRPTYIIRCMIKLFNSSFSYECYGGVAQDLYREMASVY